MKLKLGLTAATLSAGKHYGRHSAHTHTHTHKQADSQLLLLCVCWQVRALSLLF